MSNTPFIGTGHNPEGPDLPLGLGMRLAQEPKAMASFGTLSILQKTQVIEYIQAASTGDDAERRIDTAVSSLRDGHLPSC
ncbi:MAG: YdeI/OmpD-associated family protein [Oscillospiraceae bacterium]|nr:YdeI/OmpD-associated family protein [Oscillospiraceae bacterium]